MTENIKIYKRGEKIDTGYFNPDKEFESYEILPNIKKIKELREEYLNSLKEIVYYKIISNTTEWYYFDKGIFSENNMPRSTMFEFGLVRVDNKEDLLFTTKLDGKYTKAVNDGNKNIFFYSLSSLDFLGRSIKLSPVLIINEDIYNLAKIYSREFDSITKDDLSIYSDFFKVSDKPYSIISESSIEDKLRTRKITKQQYNDIILSLDKEERLVKTLRK